MNAQHADPADLPEPQDDDLEVEEEENDSEIPDEPLTEDSLPADVAAGDSDLEDLFQDAQKHKVEKPARRRLSARLDPSLRDALDSAARRMREQYTDPNNWKQGRGLVLIDKETQTVLGNFREFLHVPTTARKLVRAHEPIEINGQEEIEGWLGHDRAAELHGITWDREVETTAHVTLDEVQVDAPSVPLVICLQLNTIVRARLAKETQFASPSGNVLLKLPAGTDIWLACGVDTKAAVRKAVL